MSQVESLGIKRLEAIHYYVHNLERSRTFYCDRFDFAELGVSSPDLEKRGKQRSAVFQAGKCTVVCSQPVGEGGRASRFLRQHPAGIGTLIFEVEDIQKTFRLLEGRGGTPITDIETVREGKGWWSSFSITTPFGDTTFRFVQHEGFPTLFPGMVNHSTPKGGSNRIGFTEFDHVTSNFPTLAPAILWMEQVMGFERFWKIQFHTQDVQQDDHHGSGLKSIVVRDPKSGVKFANNEPCRPHFKKSQINIFTEEHRGPGVQHLAICVKDIIGGVQHMRKAGIEFMPTPGSYYDALPARMDRMKLKKLDEDLDTLRRLEILVDGDGPGSYLLQIFLKDAAGLYGDKQAGPFFFEVIQRKGNQGFGEGNFRALFESIEREQTGSKA